MLDADGDRRETQFKREEEEEEQEAGGGGVILWTGALKANPTRVIRGSMGTPTRQHDSSSSNLLALLLEHRGLYTLHMHTKAGNLL